MSADNSFPRPTALSSSGFAPAHDYVWKVGDKMRPTLDEASIPLLKKLGVLVPQSGPGILIASTNADGESFALFLCNLKAGRNDFRNRPIRNSLAWENLTDVQTRTLALWALDEWPSIEGELSKVFVASDTDPGWGEDENKLRSWLTLLQNKITAPSLAPSEQLQKRWWRSYGEPGSDSWKSAAEKFRTENLLSADGLVFIVSKDPNHEAYDLLRSEAGCLITDGGPEDWEELPATIKKSSHPLEWIKRKIPMAVAFTIGFILAVAMSSDQNKKKVNELERNNDLALKYAVADAKLVSNKEFARTLVKEKEKAVAYAKAQMKEDFDSTLTKEKEKAVAGAMSKMKPEFDTKLAEERTKAVADAMAKMKQEFDTKLAEERTKAVADAVAKMKQEFDTKLAEERVKAVADAMSKMKQEFDTKLAEEKKTAAAGAASKMREEFESRIDEAFGKAKERTGTQIDDAFKDAFMQVLKQPLNGVLKTQGEKKDPKKRGATSTRSLNYICHPCQESLLSALPSHLQFR